MNLNLLECEKATEKRREERRIRKVASEMREYQEIPL